MVDINALEAALEQDDDEQFMDEFPEALEGIEDDLETLLLEHPDTFQSLITRVATLDDPIELAEDEPETVERFFTIMWGSLELISEFVPSVQEEIDTDFRVQWVPEDSNVRWYAETDSEEGRISGGPGELETPDVTFKGETNTLFRMMGDDEFNSQQAFMQGEYEIEGQLPMAVQFGETMETVTENLEEANVSA